MTHDKKFNIEIVMAETSDGPAVHEIVKKSRMLDVNSRYCYLLLCSHFKKYCLVAKADGEVVGFVMAYQPPMQIDTIFVWQIAVDDCFRKLGIATRILEELLRLAGESGLNYLETTVTPSNEASLALFEGIALRYDTECRKTLLFPVDLFENGHEEEILFRVGPIKATGGKNDENI
jgi:L-2,4-diaminobutyric acid acetyltransferase